MRDDLDELASRHETEVFATRTVPVDPYTAWLERKLEREQAERPAIRWV